MNEYYQKNREKIIKQAKEWRLNHPERRKEIQKKHRKTHKEQIKIGMKKWYENNKERFREYNRQYRKLHPEKIKYWKRKWRLAHKEQERERKKKYRQKYGYTTNKKRERLGMKRLKLRFRIFQRDNFTCQYCGRKPPEVELQIDHIYPRSKKGKSNPDNYITACKDCNLGKSDIILNEFK